MMLTPSFMTKWADTFLPVWRIKAFGGADLSNPAKCLRQGKSGLIEPGTHTVDSLAYVRVFLKMVAQTTGCG
ncbi:MAG: hypothetical protein HGB35_09015 [Geobacteraceae bacterium]|nr:hypothetical protein [Geobacteraceae bacterium]